MAKTKTSGLGRGLDAIFVDNTEETTSGVNMVRLMDIEPRADQPRKSFDQESLSALADSIAAHGLIQPIIVRPSADGFYEIIAGERRWRAAKMAGLSEVPVIISDFDDQKTAEVALIENIQREDLNPVEEALGYRALIEEYGLTQEGIAKRIGKSRPAIANMLRLLELPEPLLQQVSAGKLSAGHARTLLGLKRAEEMLECARTIEEKGLSVREAEGLVRKKNNRPEPAKTQDQSLTNDVDYIGRLAARVQQMLGRRVNIVYGGRHQKIELYYEDDADLEDLLRRLCGKEILEDK
ncbi:MAG: ParB/RepB/Spo0J family partition protein [Clostridiales bacterium]|nr:ParB/RepB/Spo0J family partition protein [Clostridiales bacterium]